MPISGVVNPNMGMVGERKIEQKREKRKTERKAAKNGVGKTGAAPIFTPLLKKHGFDLAVSTH